METKDPWSKYQESNGLDWHIWGTSVSTAWIQQRYDELISTGKHGHYETLFRVVIDAMQRADYLAKEEQFSQLEFYRNAGENKDNEPYSGDDPKFAEAFAYGQRLRYFADAWMESECNLKQLQDLVIVDKSNLPLQPLWDILKAVQDYEITLAKGMENVKDWLTGVPITLPEVRSSESGYYGLIDLADADKFIHIQWFDTQPDHPLSFSGIEFIDDATKWRIVNVNVVEAE